MPAKLADGTPVQREYRSWTPPNVLERKHEAHEVEKDRLFLVRYEQPITIALHCAAKPGDFELRPRDNRELPRVQRCAIVAAADVLGWGQDSDYPTLWAWVLANVRPIGPIPCGGQLRLWTMPVDAEAKVREELQTRSLT